jgi:hypothetical protein
MTKENEGNVPERVSAVSMTIEKACKQVFDWAIARQISILSIQLVTPSIHIHKVFSVWLFFETDSLLKAYEEDGAVKQLQDEYLSTVQKLNLPEEYQGGIRFFTDTEENVKRYAGLKPLEEQ